MQVQSVAIGWQIYEMTRDPLDLGWVGLAQFLPVLLLTLPGGQLADRVDRKRIVWVAQLGYAVGATFHLLRDDTGGTSTVADDDIAQRFERLLQFLAAGFRAPAGLSVSSGGGIPESLPVRAKAKGARG